MLSATHFVEHAEGLVARLVEHGLGVGQPPRDHLGCGDLATVLAADGRDDDHDPVLGQVAAVAQHHVLEIADLEPVDERDTGGCAVDDARGPVGQLDHAAVLGEHDLPCRDAGVAGQAGVGRRASGTRRARA